MFIHWGPYSVAGIEASWPIIEPTGEITEAAYRRVLPARFNPTHFDPHAWIALARAAGQRYMVFTTKHHDGFCMFDSAVHQLQDHPHALRQGCDSDARPSRADANMPLGFFITRLRICTTPPIATRPNPSSTPGAVSRPTRSGRRTSITCMPNSRAAHRLRPGSRRVV